MAYVWSDYVSVTVDKELKVWESFTSDIIPNDKDSISFTLIWNGNKPVTVEVLKLLGNEWVTFSSINPTTYLPGKVKYDFVINANDVPTIRIRINNYINNNTFTLGYQKVDAGLSSGGGTSSNTVTDAEIDAIQEWIQQEGDNYTTGQKLYTGDTRRIAVEGTGIQIAYRGPDITSAPVMSATVLSEWEIVGGQVITSYPASQLAPKGLLYKRSENSLLLKLKDNRLLPAVFESIHWDVLSHVDLDYLIAGSTFDLLTVHNLIQRFGIFSNTTLYNAPNNAGNNCTGNWFYAGDSKNGTLTINVIKANSLGQVGGTWTNTRQTTTTKGVETSTWLEWEKVVSSNWLDSNNEGFAITGQSVTILDGHNINLSYSSAIPIYLRPKTTWDKIGAVKYTINNVVTSVTALPEWGNEVVEVTFNINNSTFNITPSVTSPRVIRYNANDKILDRTRALLGQGAEIMTLTTGAPNRLIQISWVGDSTDTTPPTVTCASGQRFFAPWITTTDNTTLNFTSDDRNRLITLVGRSDGWDVMWGG